jgi:hypothetical protein
MILEYIKLAFCFVDVDKPSNGLELKYIFDISEQNNI